MLTPQPLVWPSNQLAHPEMIEVEQAKLDAIIDMAARLKDWPLLESAIDEKIGQQIDFVGWWRDNVRRKGGERWKPIDVAEPRYQAEDAEQLTGLTKQQVSRWRKQLGIADDNPAGKPELVERWRTIIRIRAYKAAGLEEADNHRAEGTGIDEWFTPPAYIDAARNVLGAIDLDPASHPKAQAWIGATEFYTKANDGLAQDWHGRVWLNPPYSRELIGRFIKKLAEEIHNKHVKAAIVLTHNYTDTEWFHQAVAIATAICFTRGRVRFVDDLGNPCAPTQGQAFVYYGEKLDAFASAFSAYGFVVVPRTTQKT